MNCSILSFTLYLCNCVFHGIRLLRLKIGCREITNLFFYIKIVLYLRLKWVNIFREYCKKFLILSAIGIYLQKSNLI